MLITATGQAAPDRPGKSENEARAIAKDAYVYGFPLVDSYRIQWSYLVDRRGPEFKGGWNTISNTARVYTPYDKAIQTPNSDTPYSFVGADLRAEPLVLSVPAIEQGRYYSLQFIDMYTFDFAYVGSRATGNGAGDFVLAGPHWKGQKLEHVRSVIRCETDFAFVLYRTQLFNPDDIENVKKFRPAIRSKASRTISANHRQRRRRQSNLPSRCQPSRNVRRSSSLLCWTSFFGSVR